MIKQLVCVVDVSKRVAMLNPGARIRRYHTFECRLYELYVSPGSVKKRAKTHSKEIAKVPAWKLKEKLSEHLCVVNAFKWARDYTTKHSDSTFFINPMPCKFARYDELILALGFDDGTPYYVIRDKLLEEGLAITTIRGETAKARNPDTIPKRRNRRFRRD